MITSVETFHLQMHLHLHDIGIGMVNRGLQQAHDENLRYALNEQGKVLQRHSEIMMQFLKNGAGPAETGLHIATSSMPAQGTQKSASDRQIANEAHLFSKQMSVENLRSALEFQTPELRQVHIVMSRDQANIATLFGHLLHSRQWMYQPTTDPSYTEHVFNQQGQHQWIHNQAQPVASPSVQRN